MGEKTAAATSTRRQCAGTKPQLVAADLARRAVFRLSLGTDPAYLPATPFEIYQNLLNAELTPNQFRFLAVATLLLFIEFLFARHLFCRFGCAVGLFQSLAWMANNRALVVGFDTGRAGECASCNNACDNACPMRLKPRTLKRKMFTCTECAQCIEACAQVKAPGDGLLRWVEGKDALPVVDGRTTIRGTGSGTAGNEHRLFDGELNP